MNIYKFINQYINIIIILLWIILLFFNKITINKLFYFIVIILFICIYKYILKLINKDLIENFIQKYIKKENYNTLILILIKFSVVSNLLLYIIPKIETLVYNIIKVINYKINNKYIKNLLILILVNLTSPFKIMLSKFYKILNIFKELSIYEIIFRRLYGLILSVLIFTNIINMLIYFCNGKINVLIYLYIILILLSIINNLCIGLNTSFFIYVNNIINLIIINKNLIQLWIIRNKISIIHNLIKILLNLIDQNLFLIENYNKINLEWSYYFDDVVN